MSAQGDRAPVAPRGDSLRSVVSERTVVVCCGSGGVGKTTVSATFALAAARAGRRSCVVTVDPARRLADALGVESLPNTPTEVAGPWPGELHALMLDAKGTFDDLVHRYARTPEQADTILGNRLYQNLSGALSGTQEYMAMEKLYELVNSGEFDVVVVDTPPTRNALDLLDAPRRLTRFLENRLFRAILVPTRMSMKAVGVATQALLRTIARVAGAEIVQDAVTFFQAFDGMEDGFRNAGRSRARATGGSRHRLRARDLGPARRRRGGELLRREAGRARCRGGRARREPDRAAVRRRDATATATAGAEAEAEAKWVRGARRRRIRLRLTAGRAIWRHWKRTWPSSTPWPRGRSRPTGTWRHTWRRPPSVASRCSGTTCTSWPHWSRRQTACSPESLLSLTDPAVSAESGKEQCSRPGSGRAAAVR